MSEKWQQWMPLYIDRFLGSPDVQFMEPPAFKAYVRLLLHAWQTPDCTIPSDPDELAMCSGLGRPLWKKHGTHVLKKFEAVTVTVGDVVTDRLRNQVEFELWSEAKRIHEARRSAAHETNEQRQAKRSPSRNAPPPPSPTATVTVDEFNQDPLENIPEGLATTQYAGFILEELRIAAGYALRVKLADTVALLALEEACSQPEATRRLLARMSDAASSGPVKWLFWLEDGNWKAPAAPFSIGIEDEPSDLAGHDWQSNGGQSE